MKYCYEVYGYKVAEQRKNCFLFQFENKSGEFPWTKIYGSIAKYSPRASYLVEKIEITEGKDIRRLIESYLIKVTKMY